MQVRSSFKRRFLREISCIVVAGESGPPTFATIAEWSKSSTAHARVPPSCGMFEREVDEDIKQECARAVDVHHREW